MDPSLFVRLLVETPILKPPANSKSISTAINSGDSPCLCTVELKRFSSQTLPVLISSLTPQPLSHPHSASFYLDPSDLDNLLKISIYANRPGAVCGTANRVLIGRARVPIDGKAARSISTGKPFVFRRGWTSVGDGGELYLSVRAEPNPRFVLRFDGPPERSPRVFQIRGSSSHAIFTCNFECGRGNNAKERKGWSLTVHDLSGSPVAAASMVTPFVPSPGSNRVRKTNPGAWLILRRSTGAWIPCARLEAWRDCRTRVGLRLHALPEGTFSKVIALAETAVNIKRGGKLIIDVPASPSTSPFSTPGGSFDSGSGSGSWGSGLYNGFVMSCTADASGPRRCPRVEIGSEHVTCTEDAAALVALTAAANLSMDACKLFSTTSRLPKELKSRESWRCRLACNSSSFCYG